MLSKYIAVILILLTLLGEIWILYPNDLRLLFIVDLIKLYLLEHRLCIVILSFEARNKAIAIGLDHRNEDDIDKRDKYD